MVKAATIFGLLLIGNGLYGYLGSEAKSVTAFIPSFFGIAILLCGFGSALNEKLRKHKLVISISLPKVTVCTSNLYVKPFTVNVNNSNLNV